MCGYDIWPEANNSQIPLIWDGVSELGIDLSEFEKHFAAAQKKEKEAKVVW